jgi:hypothetical protein
MSATPLSTEQSRMSGRPCDRLNALSRCVAATCHSYGAFVAGSMPLRPDRRHVADVRVVRRGREQGLELCRIAGHLRRMQLRDGLYLQEAEAVVLD